MMQTWFECKVKYNKVLESGREQIVTENFLLDAVSFTDAEARMVQQMQQMVRGGEFVVTDIKKSRIAEVFPYENGEWWFKATINLVTVDEEAGKEKKMRTYYLIMADDIKEALTRLDESLSYLVIPYVISSLAVSTIIDVFPYEPSESVVPAGFTPLNNTGITPHDEFEQEEKEESPVQDEFNAEENPDQMEDDDFTNNVQEEDNTDEDLEEEEDKE